MLKELRVCSAQPVPGANINTVSEEWLHSLVANSFGLYVGQGASRPACYTTHGTSQKHLCTHRRYIRKIPSAGLEHSSLG
jgi:hypothetical protein